MDVSRSTLTALVAFLLCCLGSGSAISAPAFTPFLGTWSCLTENGSHVTMNFSAGADGTVHVHAPWTHDGRSGWTDHTLVPKSDGTWSASYKNSSNWTFDGTSSGFTGSTIVFDGIQTTDKGEKDTSRETFALLDGNTKLDHTWDMKIGGDWTKISAAHCKR